MKSLEDRHTNKRLRLDQTTSHQEVTLSRRRREFPIVQVSTLEGHTVAKQSSQSVGGMTCEDEMLTHQ